MTTPTEPHVVTLRDSPASTDFFGGHERVADALYSLVMAEPSGLTVGLEGAWGSGKSTVVALLREKLRDSNVITFVYDTWAHEGDPLRRSFLEALIKVLLQEECLADPADWESQLDNLALRRRDVEQVATTTLRPFGTFLAIITPLIPFGLLVANTGIDRSNPWLLTVGGVLATGPIIAAVTVWIRATFKRLTDPSRRQTKTVWDMFRIFEHQSETTLSTTTTETPDPTSIEFQVLFTNAVNEALSTKGSRLLVVLDNLDRVQAETAEQIIATLQPFIEDQSGTLDRPQLWILIPYDRARLNEVAGRLAEETPATANRLLDKLFDVRYDTPPLVQSDWRSYMMDCLSTALPNADPDDLEHATGVIAAARLDFHNTKTGDLAGATYAPTPRQVIQIVNRVGGVYRQWSTELPLAHLGYFAYLRHRSTPIDVGLLMGTLPSKRVGRLLGPTIQGSLAVLHFNVDLEQARQLLLFEPIKTPLLTGDHEKIRELSKVLGFWEVLETLPFHDWAQQGGQDLGQAGDTLTQASILNQAPKSTLDQIAAALTSDAPWLLNGATSGRGLGALAVSVLTKPSDLQGISHSLGLDEGKGIERDALAERIQAATAFTDALTADRNTSLTTKDVTVTVRGTPVFHITVCDLLALEDPEGRSWSVFKSTATDEELAEALTTVDLGGDRFDAAQAIPVLATQSPRPDWSQVVAALSTRIVQASAYDEALGDAVGALVTLFDLDLTNQTSLVDQGQAMKVFEFALTAKEHEAAASAAFLQLTRNAALSNINETVAQAGRDRLVQILSNPDANPTVSDSLGERILEKSPETLLKILDELGTTPWVTRWVTELARQERGISASQLGARWDSLVATLEPETLRDLIERRAPEDDFAVALDPTANEPSPPAMLRTVLEIVDDSKTASEPAKRRIQDIISSHLRQLTTEDWGSEFRDEGEWLGVMSALPKKLPSLGIPYQEALRVHAIALAHGDIQVSDPKAWPTVLAALDPSLTGQLATNILAELFRLNQAAESVFWDVYGPLLANEPGVHENDTLFHVIQDAVRRSDPAALKWAADMLKSNPKILRSKQNQRRINALTALVDELSSKDESEELHELAAVLGLEYQRERD